MLFLIKKDQSNLRENLWHKCKTSDIVWESMLGNKKSIKKIRSMLQRYRCFNE